MAIQDDGFVSLLDLDSCEERNDVKMPEGEIGSQIKDAFEKDETGILVRSWSLSVAYQELITVLLVAVLRGRRHGWGDDLVVQEYATWLKKQTRQIGDPLLLLLFIIERISRVM